MAMLCMLLLFSNLSISAETSPVQLSEIIQDAEKLQREDILSAIKLIQSYDKKLERFPIEEQIKFRKLQAELFNKKTDYSYAKKSAEAGIALTKKLARPSIIMAELLNLRGFAVESTGEYKAALEDYRAALEISESLNNKASVINSLTNIGAIYYITEDFKRSLIILNDALSLAQSLGDEELLGVVKAELGVLYTYLKQEDKAKEFHESAYQHLLKANRPYQALVALQNIAINHSSNQRYNQAISLYKQIIVKAKKFDNYTAITNTYSVMAEAYLKKKYSDPHTAHHYILIAEKYLKSVESVNVEMVFLVNKADVLSHLDKYEEALETIAYAEKIMPMHAKFMKTYALPEILRIKSEVFFAKGLYNKAYETQKIFHENTLQINKRNNLQAIEGLRVEYESEQHEIQSNVLEKKQLVQSLALREVHKEHESRNFYIIIGLLSVFGLAWFYIVNLKHQKKLLNSRETDHLTDLPNRQTILPKGSVGFNKAQKNKKYYSVLIIQVDNFKNINQVKGYDTGNNILIEISLILLNAIEQGTYCGKYSSNEFIVLLPELNAQQTEKIAEKIHNDVYNKSWEKYGLKVVSVSIGGSVNDTQYIDSFEELVKKAIRLKDEAINVGGNAICV
jgi:diguanylate cyclase (GGDEF)-like protein